MINDGEDGILPVGLRELRDEVHGYRVEGAHGGVSRYSVQRGFLLRGTDLALLAVSAPCYVFFNPRVDSWPPVLRCKESDRIISPWVSCGW